MLAEMAIVHVLSNVEDAHYFSSLAFLKNKLWATLDLHLPLVVGMYNQFFYILETFPYVATFDEWIAMVVLCRWYSCSLDFLRQPISFLLG